MKLFADLHIHSTLSPCGDLKMTPLNVVKRVKELGLNLFSITDHNSIGNLLSFKKAAERENLGFIFGMDVQTEEEIHILTYFNSYESIERVWSIVYEKLPDIKNKPDFFGIQVLVDENYNILGFEEKLLLNSSGVSIKELTKLISENQGIAIPAHIDSFEYSVLTQMGYIPDHNSFPLVEISNVEEIKDLKKRFKFLEEVKFVSFSDAHYIKGLGRNVSILYLDEEKDIILALRKGKVIIRRISNDE